MIKFKYIDIEWFGSIKSLRYNFDQPGLNLIKGENGVGKSTIFNALFWCLFGKTLKKNCTIEPWPNILDDTYKGTKVEVFYKKGKDRITIIHHASYKGQKNKLRIICNGKDVDVARDKKDGWKWIINNLGYSPELFKASVVFGQKVKRIMEEDGPTRNKILEEAFEASFITQAKIKIEERLRVSKPELVDLETQMERVSDKAKLLNDKLKFFKEQKTQFEKDKEENISEYRKEIRRFKTVIEEMTQKLGNPKSLKKRITQLQEKAIGLMSLTDETTLKHTEFKLDLEINRIQTVIEDKQGKQEILKRQFTNLKKRCSACGQPIPPKEITKQRESIKKGINELKQEIQAYQVTLNTITEDYNKASQQLKSFNKIKNKRTNIYTKIKRLESRLKSREGTNQKIEIAKSKILDLRAQIVKEQKKQFPDNTPELIRQAEDLQFRLSQILEKVNPIRKKIEIDEWLIKDPLSNSGLKSFVLDALLQKTNRELVKYESVTGFGIKMGMNLETKRKDFYIRVYKGDLEIPHADLSGGQAQLIDLAINFAISDTLDENKAVNVQLFDEVFESLSKKNIEKVGDLLLVKSQGKSVHIITHTGFQPSNSREITLEYQKGITVAA